MNVISFEEFKRLELKAAEIIAAELVAGSEKLLKLRVNLGKADSTPERQIIAGIGKYYEPETLIGRKIVIAANLEPKTLLGLESQGMLLAANDGRPVIIVTDEEVAPGSLIS